jgi:hypothetical protein
MKRRVAAIGEEIVATLEAALATPQRSGAYWRSVEKTLGGLYNEMSSVYYTHASAEIPAMYAASAREISQIIDKTKKVAETARRSATAIVNSTASRQLVEAMVTDAVASFDSAVAGGLRNAKRITRLTQQAIIEEWAIDSALASSISNGKGIDAFSRALASRDDEYSRLIESFRGERVVRAGSKTFTPEYYAEMVSRTKFHEAQSHAAMQQAANYGTDLVVVSNHNTTTAICQPYEARTFSISGKDPRFPKLDQVPPFHPNCLHLLYPVFESAMEIDGTLEAQSEFSRGKSDRPPVPAGYVPISEREAS